MGFTAHLGAAFNAIGSFNDFFERQLTAAGMPDFMPSALVNYDYPQMPLVFPSFSVTHLGPEANEVAQGRNLDPGFKGVEQIGLADIRCWESVSRAGGPHGRNLRVMRDMAARVFATGAAFPMLDVYGSTANPTGNGTIVRAGASRGAAMGTEPNPDVTGTRLLVEYRWLERVTAG